MNTLKISKNNEIYQNRVDECMKHVKSLENDPDMSLIIAKSKHDDANEVKSKHDGPMRRDIRNFDNTIKEDYIPECPNCDKKMRYNETVEDLYGEWQCYFCETCEYKCKIPLHHSVILQ